MNYDISIIGSGPVGLSLAKALSSLGLKICIIDQQTQSTLASPLDDGREVAITHLSKKILSELGSWDLIDPLMDYHLILCILVIRSLIKKP